MELGKPRGCQGSSPVLLEQERLLQYNAIQGRGLKSDTEQDKEAELLEAQWRGRK